MPEAQTESAAELPNSPVSHQSVKELTEADEFVLQWLKERAPFMQDENGVDLEHIRENLKRTPRERLERAEKAAGWVVSLRAKNTQNAKR